MVSKFIRIHIILYNIINFHSIDIYGVCDGKLDCQDKSDETDCDSIVFDKSYLKYVAPVLEGNNFALFLTCL